MFKFFSACVLLLLSFQVHAQEQSTGWEHYYHNTLNATEPYKTLLLATHYFQRENKMRGNAADLGAGTGRDTLFLLSKGWHVVALDAEQLSAEIILSRAKEEQLNLEVAVTPFSEMTLPSDLDLINASYSLPFCDPNDFPKCWQKIVDSLAIGGRFCGHFFGENDDWVILI